MNILINKVLHGFSRVKHHWNTSPTLKNIIKVSAGDIMSKLFSAASLFLIIRGLSINEYAAFTAFSAISTMSVGIIGGGINMALVRYSADYISRRNQRPLLLYLSAFSFQILLYALIGILVLIFPAQITSLLLGESHISNQVQLGLFAGLGVLIVQFSRSLYQAEERFQSYIGSLWILQVITFACYFAFWAFGRLTFVRVAWIFIIIQLIMGAIFLTTYLVKINVNEYRHMLLPQKDIVYRFFGSSGWLIGYFVVLNLFGRMDILLISRLQGKEELAMYGVAFQYYSLSLLVLGSIHAVLLPKFSKVDAQGKSTHNQFIRKWFRMSVWIILPILVFDFGGRGLFIWLNGVVYERAFQILIILTVGIFLSLLFSPLVNILIGHGDMRFLFVVGVFSLVFNILANLILIPRYGGIGAAIVTVTSMGLINVISFLRIRGKYA